MNTAQGIIEMPRVAYSLIRWSSGPQSDGHSRERQEGFAERWCQEHGVRLDDSMSMVLDGESGFRGLHRKQAKLKKRALADFLDAIKLGKITPGSILIMENMDRLTREDIDEAYDLFRSILKADIDVVTESPPRHYTKQSLKDLFSVLEVKFSMYRAHDESLQKSRRVRAAWAKKKSLALEKGTPIGRKCPAWLELRDGQYRLIPKRAEIIRRIIEMSLVDDFGPVKIAGILTDEGVPCFGRKGEWTDGYIRKILGSKALYGAHEQMEIDFDTGKAIKTGQVVQNYFEAVATESEWLALQHATRARTRARGRPELAETNLFTGLLYEATSRERMSIRGNGKDKNYVYLRVWRGTKRIAVAYNRVRDCIVRTLGELKEEDILPEGQEVTKRLRRLNELTHEVLALADRLAFLEQQQNDPSTDPDLLPSVQKGIVAIRKRHRQKKKELTEAELESSTSRTKSLGACQSALDLLDTPERRRTAKNRIRQLVEAIYLLRQKLTNKTTILHVQIYLHGGRRIYRQILPPHRLPAGTRVWQLGDCDFRAGDIGDAAPKAKKAQLVG